MSMPVRENWNNRLLIRRDVPKRHPPQSEQKNTSLVEQADDDQFSPHEESQPLDLVTAWSVKTKSATAAAEAVVVLQSAAAAAGKRLRQVLRCVDLAPDVGCERLRRRSRSHRSYHRASS